MLFCNTAPYRIKDFPISHLNQMCKKQIRSACLFRVVGVLPELWILLSCACAAGAGNMINEHLTLVWIFPGMGHNRTGDMKTHKAGAITVCQECLAHKFQRLYSLTDRRDLRVLTFKSLKASLWPRNESKFSRIFCKIKLRFRIGICPFWPRL